MATHGRSRILLVALCLAGAVSSRAQSRGSFSLSCTAEASPGGAVSCSLGLSLNAGASVESLSFAAQVANGGGAPALQCPGGSCAASGAVSLSTPFPGAWITNGFQPNVISATWVAFSTPLSGNQSLGTISFSVPAGAAGGQSYTVSLSGYSAGSGGSDVNLTLPGVNTVAVLGATQTIGFNAPGDVTFPAAPFTLSATASSGLPVAFASTMADVCATSGTNGATVAILAAGQCSITASQAGNGAYQAAPSVSRTFTVNKGSQTISFGALPDVTFGAAPFTLGATAMSAGSPDGMPVSFASNTPGVCTVSGATVTIVGGGSCTIQASQAGNANYLAASPVVVTFTVRPATQSITFNAPVNISYGAQPFQLSATADSGQSVTFSSTTATICTTGGTNGATLTVAGAGQCSLSLSVGSNASYEAATGTGSFTIAPGAPTISFTLSDAAISSSPITLNATSNSNGAVTYTSATPSVCTASGTALTLVATGQCTVNANQAAAANWAAASASASFTVGSGAPTLVFGPLSNVTLSPAPLTLAATSNSPGAITYASDTPAVCTVSGSALSLVSVGQCTVTASQATAANWAAPAPVTRSFNVTGASQTITFNSLPDVTFGAAPFTVSATAMSGGAPNGMPVSFASNTLSVCTVSGSAVTIVGGGSCSIQASQAGNANYSAATPVVVTFTVRPATQSITFHAPVNVSYGAAPFQLSATATSGQAVTFSSTTATICATGGTNGATLTVAGAGQCSLALSVAANASYEAAAGTGGFTIAPGAPTISFALSDAPISSSPITLNATSNSNGAVTYTSGTPSVCTASGNALTLVATGQCTVAANQAAAANWAAASASASFTVGSGAPTLVFGPLSNVTLSPAPLTLSATSNSPGAITYAPETPAVCTVSGNALTLVSVGQCTVTATQAAAANWTAPAPVTRSFNVTGASQTITFNPLPDVTFGAAPFTVSATTMSGGAPNGMPVSFASNTLSVCTVSGNTVTIVGGGGCSIQASQAGNANYSAATPVVVTFTVRPATQSITFNAPVNVNYGAAPFQLSATTTSGQAVTFSSTTAAICTTGGTNGATLTVAGAGQCSLSLSVASNASYEAVTGTGSFTIAPGAPTISFTLSDAAISSSPITLNATSNSNGSIAYASGTPSVCTASGNALTLVATGQCTVTANQAAAANWAAASASASFMVGSGAPALVFGPLSNVTLSPAPLTLAATSNSPGAITYASETPAVCTVSGNALTLVSTGQCTVTATQAAAANWAAPAPVTRSFNVTGASQSITFNPLPDVTFGAAPFAVGATAMSGGAPNGMPVSFASNAPSVCSVAPDPATPSAATVTILAGGSCAIIATQEGNSNFAAATPVVVAFTVRPASQSITFGSLPDVTYGAPPFTIGASASSGLPVSFGSATAAVCAVGGSTVTLLSGGACSVTATQAGNASYAAAPPVSRSFTVGRGSQTITLISGPPSSASLGMAPFTVVARASSGLTVTLTSITAAVCAVSGSSVALVGAGSCSLVASQSGDASYLPAAPVTTTFTVDSAGLAIVTASLRQAVQGLPYSQTLSAVGGAGALRWALHAGSLPAGVTLSESGSLGGAPSVAGAFPFTAMVTDSSDRSAVQPLLLQVNPPLSIPAAVLVAGVQNVAYNQSLSASGGVVPYAWAVSSGSLPPGLFLSSEGVLSGTPAASGAFSFTARLTDAASGSATAQMTLRINAPLSILTPAALPNAIAGTAYSQTLAASGGAGASYVWSISSGGLPAGLSLGAGGTLSGNPGATGPSSFTLRVSDGVSPSVTSIFTIGVFPALAITTAYLPDATAGSNYGPFRLSAAGGSGTVNWSASGLPGGIILASDSLGGAPAAAGAFSVRLTAADPASGQTKAVSLPLTVSQVTGALSVNPSRMVLGAGVGSAISGGFAARGGVAPYAWSVSSGSLPPGIALNPDGSLTGRASQAGNSTVTVQVTDSQQTRATAQLTFNILGVSPASLPAGAAMTAYSAQFAAVGGAGPYVFSASGLPSGFAVSGAGVLAGTAAYSGSIPFTVQVTDGAGVSASASCTLEIRPAQVSIPSPLLAAGRVGARYSQSLGATGGSAPYTWSALRGPLPPGLWLAPSGAISGSPSEAGVFDFAVQVVDASGALATASASIAIQPDLTVDGTALPAGSVGFDYRQALTATGGAPPYRFAVSSGGLPAGLSLSPAGLISGAPAQAGDYPFTVAVADAANYRASVDLGIPVRVPGAGIVVNAASLSFSLSVGAATPPGVQHISVESSAPGATVDYGVSASPAAPWLSVPYSGATPDLLSVALSSQALSLAAGSYRTTLTLTCASSACAGAVQTVSVALTVSARAPLLSVSTTRLYLTSASTPPRAERGSIALRNAGGGPLALTSVSCEAAWCVVGQYPASLGGGDSVFVPVTADPAQLAAGVYQSRIVVASSAGSAAIPVVFSIPAAPGLGLDGAGRSFQMQTGVVSAGMGGSFRVTAARGTIGWSASVAPGASWLSVTTPNGSSSEARAGAVQYAIDGAANLAAGTHYGQIVVTAPGVPGSPLVYAVILNVAPEPASAAAVTNSLVFFANAGAPATGAQTVSIPNSSAGAVFYSARSTAQWISVSSGSGLIAALSSAEIGVGVDAAGLTPGAHTGRVLYAVSSLGVRAITVVAIVLPSGAALPSAHGASSYGLAEAACAPSGLIPVATAPATAFAVRSSWPAPLAVQVYDDCGNTVTNAEVTASFSNDDPALSLRLVDTGSGAYSGAWIPGAPAAQATITVRAVTPSLPAAVTQLSGAILPDAAPVIAPDGITGPYNPGGGVFAPGSIVLISGSGFAAQPFQSSTEPLPTAANGTSVSIGGIPAPLFAVAPGEIEAQIPYDLAASGQYQVIVNVSGALSAPRTIQLAPAAPGLASNADGTVIAQRWEDYALVTAASPAVPGEYLMLYLVGMGAANQPVPNGAAAPLNPPARVVSPPEVTLGGVPVTVYFAGLCPGWVGLYQINIQVPDIPNGGNLLMKVVENGIASNTAILPVRK